MKIEVSMEGMVQLYHAAMYDTLAELLRVDVEHVGRRLRLLVDLERAKKENFRSKLYRLQTAMESSGATQEDLDTVNEQIGIVGNDCDILRKLASKLPSTARKSTIAELFRIYKPEGKA